MLCLQNQGIVGPHDDDDAAERPCELAEPTMPKEPVELVRSTSRTRDLRRICLDAQLLQRLCPSVFARALLELPITPEDERRLDEIHSETTPAERRLLYLFFSQICDTTGTVVEIGPYLGGTTRAIALGMQRNERAQQGRLICFDRYELYHGKDRLEQDVADLITDHSLSPRVDAELAQGKWLALFEELHLSADYGDCIRIVQGALPNDPEAPFPAALLSSLRESAPIDVLFVDGCKSWYSTKALMLHVGCQLPAGGYVIFQDYGRYTCFWLSAFCETFANSLRLVASVSGTYVFAVKKRLSASEIDSWFPDRPERWDESRFRKLYDACQRKAFARRDPAALGRYVIHLAGALAYIGQLQSARDLLDAALANPVLKPMEGELQAARITPTFRPGSPIYLD